MDFGLIGMEGLVGQETATGSPDPDGKRKCSSGSGYLKQEGSRSPEEEDLSRAPKVASNGGHDLGLSKAMALQLQQQEMLGLMRSAASFDGGGLGKSQMLSFASPTSQVSFLSTNKDGGCGNKASQSLPLSYYQHSPAPVYSRNAGFASGSLHGSFTGIRGPFTPAQWIELEHQALIFKYFTANVAVPATLLVPIRKALNSCGFSGFSTGSYSAHSYGWGPYHFGYSGSTDPEPGRCRRTDGKKWRCSRDAVPDQKYCERHINRGRHRSRKPVEGQTGQVAASGPTNPKVVPMSSAMSSSVASGGSASNNLGIMPHQLKSLQAGAPNPATDPVVNRLQDLQGLSVMPTTTTLNLKAKDSSFSIPDQHIPCKESSQSEFGFVSTDALLNPFPKTYLNCKSYTSFLDFNDQQSQEQQSNRSAVPWSEELKSDWTQLSMSIPKSYSSFPDFNDQQSQEQQSNRSAVPWSEELKSDWTQLSMSIPKNELSSSSPSQEKVALSPQVLSHGLDQTQMGLGVRNVLNEAGTKHGNWIPISWGNSMGDPLGEVLNSAGSAVGSCKKSSTLNLMSEGWDGSPQLDSSPTGVLQRAFVSLSNSGSGSSPADENKKTPESACLGDELLGSDHAASSIPALCATQSTNY